MTKQEQTQLAVMYEFIYHMHSMAGMGVPENFNPEEQAIVISNTLKHRGGLEMANQLLLAEKNEEERKKLKGLIESNIQDVK